MIWARPCQSRVLPVKNDTSSLRAGAAELETGAEARFVASPRDGGFQAGRRSKIPVASVQQGTLPLNGNRRPRAPDGKRLNFKVRNCCSSNPGGRQKMRYN